MKSKILKERQKHAVTPLSPLSTYVVNINKSHLSVADDLAVDHGFDDHKHLRRKMLDYLAKLQAMRFCQVFSELIETMLF